MVQIIDASVAIKWFVNEPRQTAALEIFKSILDKPDHFAVPELFYFELVHVFNRLVPSPNSGQIRVMEQVLQLGIKRFSMTEELFHPIRDFQNLGLSGYDSASLALTKILKGTWITFDKKAHEKVAHLKLSRLLAD